MSKEAYYFSHDSNARNDDKILELRAAYGWEGYGLYFAIVEVLRDSSNYEYPLDRLGGLALSLSVDKTKLENVISSCIDLGLFVKNDGCFYSESLLNRMAEFERKRAIRINAGRKGGIAKAKLKQNPSNAKANAKHCSSKNLASKVKESKVKESKVKESKEDGAVILPFDSKNFHVKWEQWKEYKDTEANSPYKGFYSEQSALKELSQMCGGEEARAVKIIEQAMSKGWKNLYPLENQEKNENRTSKKGYDPRNIDVQALNDWINSSG